MDPICDKIIKALNMLIILTVKISFIIILSHKYPMLSEVLLHPISHEDRYNLLNSLLYNDIELERHLVILETIATKL